MLSLLRRYRDFLVIGALLCYPFATFLGHGPLSRPPNVIDRGILAITGPIERGIQRGVDSMSSLWTNYFYFRNLRRDFESLQEENKRLRRDLTVQQETWLQNERLRKLLDYAESREGREIAARVIGVNPVSTVLSIRLDRGEVHGIQKGMPVVTAEGIVGQVHRTGAQYSDAVLITDRDSRIAASTQRTRARGTAVGAGGSGSLRFENVLRTEDVMTEDLVVTSGTDGVFPAGLIVGKIRDTAKKNHGMFQMAEIIPSVDMAKLEEVLLLPVPNRVPELPK